MSEKKQAVGLIGAIEKVDASISTSRQDSSSMLAAFTPLGAIAEAYAKTLAYRLESKRLDAEVKRVKEQAAVIHKLIDKTHDTKMEELKQRRLGLEKIYQTVQMELKHKHLERMTFLKMIETASAQLYRPGLSMEERMLAKDMVGILSAQLVAFGEKANQSLDVLVRALPTVQTSLGLLGEHSAPTQ